MAGAKADAVRLRRYRNSRLYRSIGRLLRVYNRRLVEALRARGFEDFSPAFPALLSNLDTGGSHISTLAARAGISRQAAGQLLREVERCGYVEMLPSPRDTRATMVRFSPRGRRLLAAVIEILETIDREFAAALPNGAFAQAGDALFTVAEMADAGGALEHEEEST